MVPLGRAKTNKIQGTRNSPMCFNLRSMMCTPYIETDGSILAGESKFCHKIGTIESSDEELVNCLKNMKCNYCGLEDNLPNMAKIAIGLD